MHERNLYPEAIIRLVDTSHHRTIILQYLLYTLYRVLQKLCSSYFSHWFIWCTDDDGRTDRDRCVNQTIFFFKTAKIYHNIRINTRQTLSSSGHEFFLLLFRRSRITSLLFYYLNQINTFTSLAYLSVVVFLFFKYSL